jgi:ComF family protein
MVNKWLNFIQNWCFPSSCSLCGLPATRYQNLCDGCHNELKYIQNSCIQCAVPLPGTTLGTKCGHCLVKPPHFDQSISLLAYQAPATHLVQSLKFRQQLANAALLGELLSEKIETQCSVLPERIIPVPLHRKRLRQRGFNQSMEIARPIARKFNIRIDNSICQRTRPTISQSSLDARTRQENIRDAFRVKKPVSHCHIALVDDVVTTGSTVNELARVLKKAGATRVDVWSVARAGP